MRRAARPLAVALLQAALLALLAAQVAMAAAPSSGNINTKTGGGGGGRSAWLPVSSAADLLTALHAPGVQHIELRRHLGAAEVTDAIAALGVAASAFLSVPPTLMSIKVRACGHRRLSTRTRMRGIGAVYGRRAAACGSCLLLVAGHLPRAAAGRSPLGAALHIVQSSASGARESLCMHDTGAARAGQLLRHAARGRAGRRRGAAQAAAVLRQRPRALPRQHGPLRPPPVARPALGVL
jgi:hypothetical protein